jgi:hypothetical protein
VPMEELPSHECKNCSTEVDGQYCTFCGQRYHAHKESFGELFYEFASDFLHFDSRFFKTILPLLFSPGKLTKSYNEGKQRSQFHPIRLYLFSSFVYFFLFFTFTNIHENSDQIPAEIPAVIDSIAKQADTVNLASGKTLLTGQQGNEVFIDKDTSLKLSLTSTPAIDSLIRAHVTPAQYLEGQKKLAPEKRAGYFERIVTLKLLKINLKGVSGQKEFLTKLIETFLHNIPKMLFFLLPVFALLLKLLYFRRRQFYYVDHAVLSLHYFSMIFLLLIISNYIFDPIFNTSIFTSFASVWIGVYLLLAMKRLYQEGWLKTTLKFIALFWLFLFTVVITLVVNMAITAFIV